MLPTQVSQLVYAEISHLPRRFFVSLISDAAKPLHLAMHNIYAYTNGLVKVLKEVVRYFPDWVHG